MESDIYLDLNENNNESNMENILRNKEGGNAVYPYAASFLLTEDCNLRCEYCYEKDGRRKKVMSEEVARKGLEFLFESAKKGNKNQVSITMFGGEPTLNPDVMEVLLEYGRELERKYNIKYSPGIITNATILTDRIYNMIEKHLNKGGRFSCQLSIDGYKEVQDIYRVKPDGSGSFDDIEKNIPKFKELFKDNPRALNVHGVLNKKSLPHLYDSYKFFKEEWGIDRIWFMPVHDEDWDEDDVEIYRKQLNMIADYILENVRRERDIQEVKDYSPISRCLRNQDGHPPRPCGVGRKYITISAKGDIYPCHHFYFADKQTKIGDIFNGIDDSKRKMFLDYSTKDLSCLRGDKSCDHYFCYRCPALNYQVKGNMLSQVTYCNMSYVEKEVQMRVRKEIKEMEDTGLLNKRIKGNNKGNLVDSWVEDGKLYKKYKVSGDKFKIIDKPVDVGSNVKNNQMKGSGNNLNQEALLQILLRMDKIEERQEKIINLLNEEE